MITDCQTQKDMKRLAGARYLKENPKGVQEMSKIMEDMRNEAVLTVRRDIAHTFIMMGKFSYEEIAQGTKLPIEEIKEMAERSQQKDADTE